MPRYAKPRPAERVAALEKARPPRSGLTIGDLPHGALIAQLGAELLTLLDGPVRDLDRQLLLAEMLAVLLPESSRRVSPDALPGDAARQREETLERIARAEDQRGESDAAFWDAMGGRPAHYRDGDPIAVQQQRDRQTQRGREHEATRPPPSKAWRDAMDALSVKYGLPRVADHE